MYVKHPLSTHLYSLSLHYALPISLHELSGRRGAFIDMSAGEVEPGLALDQLFGHVRGAFTGAMSRHRGLLAEAEGRSEEHTSELQSPDHLVCRLLLEKKKVYDT